MAKALMFAAEEIGSTVISYWPSVKAVDPKSELIEMFYEAGGEGKSGVAQVPVCCGPNESECPALAREQFAGSAGEGDGRVVQPLKFDVYSQFVREEDTAQMIP